MVDDDNDNDNDNDELLQLKKLKNEFEENGYLKVPKSIFSLDKSTIDVLHQEFDKLFDGDYETGIYPDEIHWRSGISKDHVTRELCNAWKSSNVIKRIVASEELGKLACELMNWKCCRLGQDDVIYKPPDGSTPVGYHTDGTYISNNFEPRKNNCLTLWIALDDTDEENGALQYVPKSHRWSMKHQNQNSSTIGNEDNETHNTENEEKKTELASFHVKDEEDYKTPLRKAAINAGQNVEEVEKSIVTVDVPAGELLVHHQDIWHGSGPNLSQTRLRRSLVVHLINGEVTWRTTSSPSSTKRPYYIYGRYYIRGETIPREDFFPITYAPSNDNNNNESNSRNNRQRHRLQLQRTSWLDE